MHVYRNLYVFETPFDAALATWFKIKGWISAAQALFHLLSTINPLNKQFTLPSLPKVIEKPFVRLFLQQDA